MSDSARWDERFRQGSASDADPDPFLVRCVEACDLRPGGEAADVACGAGRNTAFLAGLGLRVTAIDFSAEALRLTREKAPGSNVETRRIDLEAPDVDLGDAAFDLVCVVRFLHRPLFPALRRATRPGGWLICHTFTTDNLKFDKGPRDPNYLLTPGELLHEFAAWRVLRYEEHWRGRGTAALLARKP